MNKKTSLEIINEIKKIIPNPKCELDFNNNFELICAVLLSAQTTDKRVNVVTKELFSKYPTPQALMNAEYNDVYNIILSLGLAKNKAKNIIELSKKLHEEYNDILPNSIEELTKLPGVGRKTANVVLALGFNIPSIAVDTHVHRMSIRLGYAKKDFSVLECEEQLKKYIPKELWIEAHHLLLLYGRYYCKAINPDCKNCKLIEYCKYKNINKH